MKRTLIIFLAFAAFILSGCGQNVTASGAAPDAVAASAQSQSDQSVWAGNFADVGKAIGSYGQEANSLKALGEPGSSMPLMFAPKGQERMIYRWDRVWKGERHLARYKVEARVDTAANKVCSVTIGGIAGDREDGRPSIRAVYDDIRKGSEVKYDLYYDEDVAFIAGDDGDNKEVRPVAIVFSLGGDRQVEVDGFADKDPIIAGETDFATGAVGAVTSDPSFDFKDTAVTLVSIGPSQDPNHPGQTLVPRNLKRFPS